MRKSVLGGLVLLALLGGGCASIGGLTGGSAAPAWVLQPPADTAEAWWGVGEGRDRDAAKGAALRDVAARLRVGISGKLDTQVSETNGKVDRRASARVSEEVARTEFRNYTIEQTAQSGKLVHVLVKVDRRAFVTDVRAAIEPLDAAIRQGTANLDAASPIERFVTLRKFHEARVRGDEAVAVWGTGTPRREFLYSDDMADACVFLMNLPEERYTALLGSDESVSGRFEPPLVNIGVGADVTIAELAALVARVVGYAGRIEYDRSKPDGTPRKLMDVGLINAAGWKASTALEDGLRVAYAEFVQQHAG